MAHQIEKNQITGLDEIAWVGEKPWHGLGQELEQSASIEDWVEAAQMGWEIEGSPVTYKTQDGAKNFTGQQVLYRNDTYRPIGIVGDNFKVVQPREILEFFRDLTEIHDMKLSVAGCLFGGKRFWATAETGRASEIIPGDEVRGQLLLMTGSDGGLATSAKFVSTRVVCNNTLQIAMNESGAREARRTHRVEFDPKDIKIELGLLDASWSKYIDEMKSLTMVKMNDDKAYEFFKKLLFKFNSNKTDEDITRSHKNGIDDLMYRLRNGLGADSGRGTAWNVLNAVTEKYTHGSARRDSNRQFVNSLYGHDAAMKTMASKALLELA
jgi:phage/plasmid-like protein (TIGR03299 family)